MTTTAFLEQVTNVNWGGKAVVIMSHEAADVEGVSGKIYRGEGSDWQLISSNNVAFRSQSYAKLTIEKTTTPTFLLGAGWTNVAQILYSNDGESWSTVFQMASHGGEGVTGIVWNPDENKFFAAGNVRAANQLFTGRLWSSADGTAWVQDREYPATTNAGLLLQSAQLVSDFAALCVKPENTGGVPDGLQAYNSSNSILMRPAALDGWTPGGPSYVAIDLTTLTIENLEEGTISSVGFPVRVHSVSYAAGMWHVVGIDPIGVNFPITIFVSKDNGETWEESFTTTGYYPAGVSSAAKHDIDSQVEG